MRLEMLPRETWPRDVELSPIAQIALTPAELTAKAGISFHRIQDDLGPLDVAVVKIPSGEVIVLERHVFSPAEGTSVSIDASLFTRTSLERLISELGLHRDAITWVGPLLDDPRDEAERDEVMGAKDEHPNESDASRAERVATTPRVPKAVYIVHGRDVGLKDEVARFLESTIQAPLVIMHEQPSPAQTISKTLRNMLCSIVDTYNLVLDAVADKGTLYRSRASLIIFWRDLQGAKQGHHWISYSRRLPAHMIKPFGKESYAYRVLIDEIHSPFFTTSSNANTQAQERGGSSSSYYSFIVFRVNTVGVVSVDWPCQLDETDLYIRIVRDLFHLEVIPSIRQLLDIWTGDVSKEIGLQGDGTIEIARQLAVPPGFDPRQMLRRRADLPGPSGVRMAVV